MSSPFSSVFPSQTLRIRTNRLLEGAEQTLPLEHTLSLVRGSHSIEEPRPNGVQNLSEFSEADLKRIHAVYGPGGLFRIVYLATSHETEEFHHFWDIIGLGPLGLLSNLPTADIQLDNDTLHHSDALEPFNWHVLQPSVARKLYNPGCHPGYLVYGLGGPKILVSHPFRGVKGELYDVYGNSADVVTSLMLDGYAGTFLFMDNMIGLNQEIQGVPAWLLWFSRIATHSDIVLFVKERNGKFSDSQLREMDFTPDLVQKKIVEIMHLTWATEPRDISQGPIIYVGPEGRLSEDEFRVKESEHAMPLIENHAGGGFPHDRIFRLDEDGNLTQFPPNYPVYGY
jgi:hypothetical protein